jgi:hypothetical protein
VVSDEEPFSTQTAASTAGSAEAAALLSFLMPRSPVRNKRWNSSAWITTSISVPVAVSSAAAAAAVASSPSSFYAHYENMISAIDRLCVRVFLEHAAERRVRERIGDKEEIVALDMDPLQLRKYSAAMDFFSSQVQFTYFRLVIILLTLPLLIVAYMSTSFAFHSLR